MTSLAESERDRERDQRFKKKEKVTFLEKCIQFCQAEVRWPHLLAATATWPAVWLLPAVLRVHVQIRERR